jgi:hypothetical protein
MRQQPHLNDFFAKARSEPPVTSEGEIEQLLDNVDLHGRQSAPSQSTQTITQQLKNIKRIPSIAMGSITALLFGAAVSTGIFFFGPETPTETAPVSVLPGTSLTMNTPSTTTAPKVVPPALSVPASIASVEILRGRGDDQKVDQPVDKEKDEKDADKIREKIGQEVSKELQGLVENYWMEKINGYKARIDGMLNRNDLDELNRLRVRWALTDKSKSPLGFAAQMEMNAVNADGEQVQVNAGIGNSGPSTLQAIPTPPIPPAQIGIITPEGTSSMAQVGIITPDGTTSSTTKMSMGFTINSTSEQVNESEDGNGKTVTMTKEVHIIRNNSDGDVTELSNIEGMDGKAISLTNSADGKTVSIAIAPDASSLEGVDTEGAIAIAIAEDSDDIVTVDNKAEHTIIVRRDPAKNKEVMTINNNGDRTILIRRNGMGEDSAKGNSSVKISTTTMTNTMETKELGMAPIMGMLKGAIQADNSESSKIMVATWEIAEAHRAPMNDLKATILNDVATFAALVREKMGEYVAEHGEELPAEMRRSMTDKSQAEQDENTANLLKTLEPIYGVIIEPMVLLYNGSDINNMLTSAIAEPVAGVTLAANSTLKQSYPNPASADATIEYTLQEPSNATTLRLFDSQGGEVRNLNLGAQSAGDHKTMLDVRNLPTGTYLYHLTIGTPRGEQVFSKTMQIVR